MYPVSEPQKSGFSLFLEPFRHIFTFVSIKQKLRAVVRQRLCCNVNYGKVARCAISDNFNGTVMCIFSKKGA
jgi:hypothetical protein